MRVERRSRRRLPRRLVPLAPVALLVAILPLSALAAISFNDLNPGSVHNANIQAIADAGSTTGCDPGVSSCPDRNVTREEKASFLARTAGLGSNPDVGHAPGNRPGGASSAVVDIRGGGYPRRADPRHRPGRGHDAGRKSGCVRTKSDPWQPWRSSGSVVPLTQPEEEPMPCPPCAAATIVGPRLSPGLR